MVGIFLQSMKVSRSDMDYMPPGSIPYMSNQNHGSMSGNGKIVSLSNLLDLILQRTYNELLILSDMLVPFQSLFSVSIGFFSLVCPGKLIWKEKQKFCNSLLDPGISSFDY